VVIGFVSIFSDFGLNAAYVSKQNIDCDHRVSLFWLNFFFAFLTTGFLVSVSPFVAKYYHNPELEILIELLSTTLVLGALGQQLKISAEKSLVFKPVAIIEIFTTLIGLVICVSLVSSGHDVYSIVIGSIISSFLSTLLIWIFLSDGFVLRRHFSFSDVKPFLNFGIFSVGSAVLGYLSRSLDVLVGGHYLSASQLGLYSVPRNLSLQIQFIVNPIISRVGFPLIAKSQSNKDLVKVIYLKTMNMTSSINAPIYVGIFFFSDHVVNILFGPNWIESSNLMKLLAAWGAIRSTGNPVGSLAEGMGRADLEFKWTFFCLFFFSVGTWIGATGGANGIALSQLLLISFLVIPNWFFLVKPLCGANFYEYIVITFRPFLLAIAATFLSSLLLQGAKFSWAIFVIEFLLGFLFYLVFSFKFNKDWFYSMIELVNRSYDRK